MRKKRKESNKLNSLRKKKLKEENVTRGCEQKKKIEKKKENIEERESGGGVYGRKNETREGRKELGKEK